MNGSRLFSIATLALAFVAQCVESQLIITGVVDATLSGGVPKAVELYAVAAIPDLSVYSIAIEFNSNTGSNLPVQLDSGTLAAGAFYYITNQNAGFNTFFGMAADQEAGSINSNGDDRFELYESGVLVDRFGVDNTDGTGEAWEFTDGWAYRKDGTGPDPSTFVVSDWTFSGTDALDNLSENLGANAFPIGTYSDTAGPPGPGPTPPGPAPITKIHEIQGSGPMTPLSGQTVTVEAIVVGDYQDGASGTNGDLNGFYLEEEDPDRDADPSTSEGIFVSDGSNPAVNVAVGDKVQVTGVAGESFDQTEINSVTSVDIISSGNALPTTAIITLPTPADLEAFEGMLVEFRVPTGKVLVVSDGEVLVCSVDSSEGRPFQFTARNAPDVSGFAQHLEDLAKSCVTIDDGLTVQNPDPAEFGGVIPVDPVTTFFRGGSHVTTLKGPLNYSFSKYRVLPKSSSDLTFSNDPNPRPTSVGDVGGSIKVASANVLNYFTTLNSRGADTQSELDRQLTKIVNGLVALDADIIGVVEIENNGDVALSSLVGALNDATSPSTYAFVATGSIGTDEIKCAFIYQPATVATVGAFKILDSSVDANFIDTKNRPVLIQSFRDISNNVVFTVAVNHFKSKSTRSDCDELGDPDKSDGSGNCDGTRTKAATALIDYLETDPTNSGNDNFLVIGDLNSYAREPPIQAFINAGYTNLAESFIGELDYSFVFNGQFGALDYILAKSSIAPKVTGATVYHVNSDEADLFDYDESFNDPSYFNDDPFRFSDHDPIVIGLSLDSETTLCLSTDVCTTFGRPGVTVNFSFFGFCFSFCFFQQFAEIFLRFGWNCGDCA